MYIWIIDYLILKVSFAWSVLFLWFQTLAVYILFVKQNWIVINLRNEKKYIKAKYV